MRDKSRRVLIPERQRQAGEHGHTARCCQTNLFRLRGGEEGAQPRMNSGKEKEYLRMKMVFIQRDWRRPGTAGEAFEVILAEGIDVACMRIYT